MSFSSQPTVSIVMLMVFAGSNFIHISTESVVPDECQKRLESYAEKTANFTLCTIQNARPIKVCQACVDAYIEVLQSYQRILKMQSESGLPCKSILTNVDRLEVVEASYSFVINQWNRADCNNCFQNKSGSITPETNKYTAEVIDMQTELLYCISNNSNEFSNSTPSPVCKSCSDYYFNLNSYFNENKKIAHGFCMDIVDLMNSTRSSWSQEYGCHPESKRPELLFLVTASTFCAIPFVFYLLVRLCTVKHLLPILPSKRWDQYLTANSSTANLTES